MKILVVASFPNSLLGFRGALLDSMLAKGLEVHAAAPDLPSDSTERQKLETKGVVVHEVPMQRTGTNPAADLSTLLALLRLMRRIRPSHVLTYTIKPVIYGSVAGWLAGVPHRFALITGLGQTFQDGPGSQGPLERIVQGLYAIAMSRVHKVFFQNPDDEALFHQRKILKISTPSCVVNGSGVDLSVYHMVPLPIDRVRFLLVARLLASKGVRIYAEAAKRIKQKHPEAIFSLVGWVDDNPDSISQEELDCWVAEGSIEYLGRQTDVRPSIEACNVYVLPSYYREGTPRSVLEAMSMGRAIVTTDAPGCRETVVEGQNGFLVQVKSVDALVAAMNRFIEDPSIIERMGKRSREIAEEKYDVHKVNAVMLREMGL